MDTNFKHLDTVAKIMAYIDKHYELFGFRPLAIGLRYGERVSVLKEMGASDFEARCTNVTANLKGVLLVVAW